MLVFKVISTVLLALSACWSICKNCYILDKQENAVFPPIVWLVWIGWSLIWRAFVIVSVWLI